MNIKDIRNRFINFIKTAWPAYFFIIITMFITFYGLFGVEFNFGIQSEFYSGLLTALSITFGFWIVLLEKNITKSKKRVLIDMFFWCFGLFLRINNKMS